MPHDADQIEKALREMSEKLTEAWTNNQCLTCPVAELAALAAATYAFYKENRYHTRVDNLPHWTLGMKR